MAHPGISLPSGGVRDGDVVASFPLTRATAERMLVTAKAYRSEITRKIAWCWTVPALGWFGRVGRLEREHDRANNSVRDLIRLLREAV